MLGNTSGVTTLSHESVITAISHLSPLRKERGSHAVSFLLSRAQLIGADIREKASSPGILPAISGR